MICGAAKRSITPPAHLLPDLHGLGGITFSGVLDELFVRVMVLDDGARRLLFVVFDLDKVPYPEKYLPMLAELADVSEDHITLTAIHTHTAPVTGWRPTEGPNFVANKPENVQKATHEYEEFLEQAVRACVTAALAAMVPVRTGWVRGESWVNINRLQDYRVRREDGCAEIRVGLGQDPAAPVDRGMLVWKAEDMQGNLVACLTDYAVHNCVMIGNRCGKDGGTLLSSDLGGNVSRMLEEHHPGCVALWVSGAAGDVNPVLSNEIFYPDPATGAQTAYRLPAGESAPVMMLHVLAARHYADVLRALERIVCTADAAEIGGGVRWLETPGKGGEPYRIRLHLTRMGELRLWGVSGELYSSLGTALTDSLPGSHFIINHDASLLANSGYIYDDETLRRDRDGVLPGRRSSVMLPGLVKDALLAAAAELWNTNSGKEENS